MIWLALLLAGDQAAPFNPVVARNMDEWLTPDDYPFRAYVTDQEGITEADILVNPAGEPQTCTVPVSSGSEDLDLQACAAGMRRGRFAPATDEAGRPTHGVFRFRTRWVLFENDKGPIPPDVTLQVATLPQGQTSLHLELGYIVDEQGGIRRCAVLKSSGVSAYDEAACATMPQRYRFAPARDKAGKAWRVVRTQTVGFQAAHAGSRQ